MPSKQIVIPSCTTPALWKTCTTADLKKEIKKYYQLHLQGKSVVNQCLGHRITLSAQGKNKITNGGAIYNKKAAVLLILPDLLRYAVYSNFGQRKPTDPTNLIGYFNFKAKCKIDGKVEYVRIAVLVYKDGKIYFNHEINIIRQ